jgi:hypothetical protein
MDLGVTVDACAGDQGSQAPLETFDQLMEALASFDQLAPRGPSGAGVLAAASWAHSDCWAARQVSKPAPASPSNPYGERWWDDCRQQQQQQQQQQSGQSCSLCKQPAHSGSLLAMIQQHWTPSVDASYRAIPLY